MKTFLKGLVLVPVGIVVVLLAIANRAPVTLSFDPFSRTAPAFSLTMPLFVALIVCVMVGVVVGGIASWTAQGKQRQTGRQQRRDVARLETETQRLKNALASRAPALPGDRHAA